MQYLIDGYNLLFAQFGAPPRQSAASAIDYARRRLLEALRTGHAADPAAVTVIFDANRLPRGVAAEQDYHGIHIRYAVHEDEADDLIEELIRRSSAPRQLVVVSDDHRLQRAGRRRHCVVMGCAAYLNRLEGGELRHPPKTPQSSAKPQSTSEQEMEHWLREFGGLKDDPAAKELFDGLDFEGEDRTP